MLLEQSPTSSPQPDRSPGTPSPIPSIISPADVPERSFSIPSSSSASIEADVLSQELFDSEQQRRPSSVAQWLQHNVTRPLTTSTFLTKRRFRAATRGVVQPLSTESPRTRPFRSIYRRVFRKNGRTNADEKMPPVSTIPSDEQTDSLSKHLETDESEHITRGRGDRISKEGGVSEKSFDSSETPWDSPSPPFEMFKPLHILHGNSDFFDVDEKRVQSFEITALSETLVGISDPSFSDEECPPKERIDELDFEANKVDEVWSVLNTIVTVRTCETTVPSRDSSFGRTAFENTSSAITNIESRPSLYPQPNTRLVRQNARAILKTTFLSHQKLPSTDGLVKRRVEQLENGKKLPSKLGFVSDMVNMFERRSI